jgi:hypothetical protein
MLKQKNEEKRRNGRDDGKRVETTQNRAYGGKQVSEVAMKKSVEKKTAEVGCYVKLEKT